MMFMRAGEELRGSWVAWAAALLLSTAGCGEPSGSDDEADSEDAGDTAADDDDDDDDSADDDDDDSADDDDDDSADDDDDDDDDDIGGTCQPTPVRMIVLGDSIVACAGVGGIDSPTCAPKILHNHYSDTYGPTSYENLSVGGSITRDVVESQLPGVETGINGHALVVIYIGGNDLSPFLTTSDQAAIDGFNNLAPELAMYWEEIFAFFEDEANFPDGVTLLMNTQYDPFDGCTAAPYNVSQVKLGLLGDYNTQMTERAGTKDWVFIADQYSVYLGHGHHYAVDSCPNFTAGYDGWMNDLIHPNAAGHASLAEVMAATGATAYADCP